MTDALKRWGAGLLLGLLIATASTNWSAHERSSEEIGLSSPTARPYHWQTVFASPITWPLAVAYRTRNFECDNLGRLMSCKGTIDDVKRGHLYAFILIGLYMGLFTLYWPFYKKKEKLPQKENALAFGGTALGVVLSLFLLFPDIPLHNMVLYALFALVPMYIMAGTLQLFASIMGGKSSPAYRAGMYILITTFVIIGTTTLFLLSSISER